MNQLSLLAEYPDAKAAFEPVHSFMMRVARVGEPLPAPKLDHPELCVDYWRNVIAKQHWFDDNKEHLIVLMLDTRYNIIGYSLVSIGTLNESIAHPREIFRPVLVAGAYAFIVMHNHPSGDPSPSQSDHSLTRRLQ